MIGNRCKAGVRCNPPLGAHRRKMHGRPLWRPGGPPRFRKPSGTGSPRVGKRTRQTDFSIMPQQENQHVFKKRPSDNPGGNTHLPILRGEGERQAGSPYHPRPLRRGGKTMPEFGMPSCHESMEAFSLDANGGARVQAIRGFASRFLRGFPEITINEQRPPGYNKYAGAYRMDGSEKSSASRVAITLKGAVHFSARDRIRRKLLDLSRPDLHSTGKATSPA